MKEKKWKRNYYYKSLIQIYENKVKDMDKEKSQLENIILETKKLEHDYKELKISFEKEKNKNIINNIIINEKNNVLKFFHESFKLANNNKEKIIKNCFDSVEKLNFER